MVVAAGRDEQHVARGAPARDVAGLEDDVEPQDADVEVADAIDVGGAQVDVADPHTAVDGIGGCLGRPNGTLLAARHTATVPSAKPPADPGGQSPSHCGDRPLHIAGT